MILESDFFTLPMLYLRYVVYVQRAQNYIIQAKRSFVECGDSFTGITTHFSYATVCLHPSVSLNNEKNCREISEDKIAVCEKTAGLRSGNSSDLDSACLKVLVPVKIFQI